MAHYGNIIQCSASMQKVLTLNSSKGELRGLIKLKGAWNYSQRSEKSNDKHKVGIQAIVSAKTGQKNQWVSKLVFEVTQIIVLVILDKST